MQQELGYSYSSGKNVRAAHICKIAWKTIPRYGAVSLLFLCIGFFYLFQSLGVETVLLKEQADPYELSATAEGPVSLETFQNLDFIQSVTPVLTFDTEMAFAETSTLSGKVTAVMANYPELSFLAGGMFPEQSNMPFLVLNKYAAEHFVDEDKREIKVQVNDTVTLTVNEEPQTAVICGIFQDDLETPVSYMSYQLAAKALPVEETTNYLIRLMRKDAISRAEKELRRQKVQVSYDQSLLPRREMLQEQAVQGLITALALLSSTVILMRSTHRKEQDESRRERQMVMLSGMTRAQIRQIARLRILFADGVCFLIALLTALLLGKLVSLTYPTQNHKRFQQKFIQTRQQSTGGTIFLSWLQL